MKSTRPPATRSVHPFAGFAVVGASLIAFAACSAAEDGDDPDVAQFATLPGVGAAGTPSAGLPAPTGSGGSSSVTPGAPTGNAGNGAAGLGNEVTPGAPLNGNGAGGTSNAPPAGNAGTGAGGSASTGQGGSSKVTEPPPPAAGPGRVGAELCPAGPFGSPLPSANPPVTKLFSVGENNFFNFEGPVWVNDALFFSEISGGNNPPPANINRFVPGGMLERGVIDDTGSNGLGVTAQGNLIAATHDTGALSTFPIGGGARGQLGAQTFDGARFNSPNDLVQRNDGNTYFTDPNFQAPGNPQNATRVYRISPQGAASVVDASIGNPNGITLSPDGNTLYVTGGSRLVRYALSADGTPSAGSDVPLQEGLQAPDGMGVDCAGNVYMTEHSRRLVRVIAPDGTELGRIGGAQAFDQNITNVAFGGPNRTTLFVTSLTQGTQGGLFSVQLNVPGLPY